MRNVWGMFLMFGRQTFVFCCAEGLTDCRLDCRLNLEHDRSDDYAPCGNTRTGAGAPWRAQSVYEVGVPPRAGQTRAGHWARRCARAPCTRCACRVPYQCRIFWAVNMVRPSLTYITILQAAIRSIGDADVGQISEFIATRCDMRGRPSTNSPRLIRRLVWPRRKQSACRTPRRGRLKPCRGSLLSRPPSLSSAGRATPSHPRTARAG